MTAFERQHQEEIATWENTCEDLQQDLAAARSRILEVESRVTSLQQQNIVLSSRVLKLSNTGKAVVPQACTEHYVVSTTWMQTVNGELQGMQVPALSLLSWCSFLTLAIFLMRKESGGGHSFFCSSVSVHGHKVYSTDCAGADDYHVQSCRSSSAQQLLQYFRARDTVGS